MPAIMFRGRESALWQASYNHVGSLASRVLLYSGVETPVGAEADSSATSTTSSSGTGRHSAYLLSMEDMWRGYFLHSVTSSSSSNSSQQHTAMDTSETSNTSSASSSNNSINPSPLEERLNKRTRL